MRRMLWIIALLFVATAAPYAHSQTVITDYTYTGNPFDSFAGNDACPPQCGITGSFTIAGPPPVDLSGSGGQFEFDVTPLAYSFTDGNVTFTNSNSCFDFFAISTDGAGNITAWVMRLFTPTQLSPWGGNEGSYEYLNEPKPSAPSTMHAHRGVARMMVDEKNDRLDGEYYSGRDRQNIGTIQLRRS